MDLRFNDPGPGRQLFQNIREIIFTQEGDTGRNRETCFTENSFGLVFV